MKEFYITVEGKPIKVSKNTEDFKHYRKVCLKIWGAVPYDVSWAKDSKLYKDNS